MSFLRPALRFTSICLGGVIVLGSSALAQGTLEASYRATLGGLPVGTGSWTIDVADDRYTMAASGQASGLLKLFAGGEGTGAARGLLNSGRSLPTSFAIAIRTPKRTDEVKMAIAGGTVKDVSIEPTPPPNPKIIPVTEAHKRGVVDPMSAGLIPAAGARGVGPEACQRTVPVFDGRARFDLTLSFKRVEHVTVEKGYDGPAVVCGISYRPIAGIDPEKFAIRYLRETRDIEVWLAPITGTKFLGVYRMSVPTVFGPAVLQATRFSTTAKSARATLPKT
jgi:Protein of unknown function (DUF3108)